MKRPYVNVLYSKSIALSLVVLGCAGCTGSSSTSTTASSKATEFWDVLYMHDSRVGYALTRIQSFDEDGQPLVRMEGVNELTLKRFGEISHQKIDVTSIETPTGEVKRVSSRISAGREETVAEGNVEGNQLLLVTKSTGKSVETKLSWKDSFRGYFAAEQSLRQQPMKPGESRSFKALAAGANQLEDVRLQAIDYEDTKLLNETRRLLRVRKTEVIGPTRIDSFLWVDDGGETLKSHLPGMELVWYRTTREIATKTGQPIAFDLGRNVIVAIKRQLENPHSTQKIVYRATMKNGEVEYVFAEGASQVVKAIDMKTAELTVIAVRPNQPPNVKETEAVPNEADLASNNYIQCDNERIVMMARDLGAEDAEPWTIARAAEQFVHRSIKKKNFSQALATAADVAKSMEGDCTEHAVLIAALCRARKIPARVAVGLVYFEPAKGMAYHMWNEVWIQDRWVPLDGTLGLGGIGADHIKLGTSSLDGQEALNVFLPLANVVGNLELEVLEVAP